MSGSNRFFKVSLAKFKERLRADHPDWDDERIERAAKRKIRWVKKYGVFDGDD
ncbi:protein of unknown function [Pseudodesulfovibrio profundus]|uniref:Uncharacterized protein n=1 Tax=Pseudodesulfovibrio profundus TaxID=57320 RepID=A0A2C8FDV1_9BACT|nr:hypothetical protein [Pseudodesulfovibrio profundus]SOB60635.1 protein of unknown function [Pseudodesulfovibrio profundus]